MNRNQLDHHLVHSLDSRISRNLYDHLVGNIPIRLYTRTIATNVAGQARTLHAQLNRLIGSELTNGTSGILLPA